MRLSVRVLPGERVVDAMRRVLGWFYGESETLLDAATWLRA